MSVMNPTSRPVQPELPPLTTRRQRRNAEYVRAARTGQIDAAPKASPGRRAAQPTADVATQRTTLPEVQLLIDRAKASGTPAPTPAAASRRALRQAGALASPRNARRIASRRGQRSKSSTLSMTDRAVIGTVALVGLVAIGLGIVGIVDAFMSYQFDAIGFFNSCVAVIAGGAWTALAPFKVIETSE